MSLVAAERIEAVRSALVGTEAWLVGGVVRDRELGRPLTDLDLVTASDVERSARALASEVGAAVFPLSDEFGGWRVVPREGGWQVDLSPLADGGIEADMARRDFTVNALAEPLQGGETLDLHGGLHDLRAGVLRAVGPLSFASDPLRVVRLARLGCELGFEATPDTLGLARESADGLANVAGERILGELVKLLSAADPVRGVRLMHECGAMAGAVPELLELEGVEQSSYHHLDVWEHTLAVLQAVVDIQADPSALGAAGNDACSVLEAPLADGMTRWQGLRLGALLHDVAKARTKVVWDGGRIGFPGHDEEGAAMAVVIVDRLRGSGRLRDAMAALVRNHLVAGFMTHDMPLEPRSVHHYLRRCGDTAVDVTVLSVADRLATRGRKSDEAIARHLEVTAELLAAAVKWEAEGPPEPLVRGDDLAAELGIEPGPQLGPLLDELEAAAWAGEVSTREEAIEHSRRHLERGDG
ncbi:MAG: HD domain-containing protein [Actinomycetes bacterium]